MRALITAVLTTFVLPACAAGMGEAVIISPYGEWSSNSGHELTIYTDGTYRICRAGSCSDGGYRSEAHTSLSITLSDFLAKQEVVNIAEDLRICASMRRGNTGGNLDLVFDTSPNIVDRDPASLSEPLEGVFVSYDCEIRRPVTFLKFADIHHPGALAELQRIGEARRRTPPPRMK